MAPLPLSTTTRNTALPITLVSGFLGAGKTLFTAHELTQREGQHAAALVMGSSEFCPDAGVLRAQLPVERATSVIELRDDDPENRWQDALPEAVKALAQGSAVDHLFVEISGRLQLPAVLKVLPAAAPGVGGHELSARIAHLVCLVDALDFYHRVVRPSNAAQALPNTPLQRLLASQARAATHIVVNKADLLSEDQRHETLAFLHLINPAARLAMATFGQVPPEFLAEPAMEVTPLETGPLPNIPSVKETSILPPTFTRAVFFTARRPFHPARFWSLCAESWPTVMRAKGHFWLPTRMECVGSLSQSFAAFSCAMAGHWWAVMPPEAWPTDAAERARIDEAWEEPFGDRRQQILFEGEPGPVRELEIGLRECLLTDEEMDAGLESWATLDDPWPEWELEEQEDDSSTD